MSSRRRQEVRIQKMLELDEINKAKDRRETYIVGTIYVIIIIVYFFGHIL